MQKKLMSQRLNTDKYNREMASRHRFNYWGIEKWVPA